jgi:multidrug efflux pump subunit AcrA (membrane-fusion protein)
MSAFKTVAGWVVPLVILGAGVGIFLALGRQPPPARKEMPAAAAVAVRTVVAQSVTDGLTVAADGVVVPLREITLAAEVAGRVRSKADECNEGHFVKAGSLLLEIDPRDYELDAERLTREQAQAGLAIEEADEELAQNAVSIDIARRQVDLARREVARLATLRAGKIVTESDYDRALRDELTATNSMTALEGQKRVLSKRRNRLQEAQSLAGTMLEKARLDLERTRITAPVDGVIVEDRVEKGSFVAKGTPLVTIEDTSAVEVRTSLEMADVARIWGSMTDSGRGVFGTPAHVVYRIGDAAYEWDGVLSRQEGRGLDEKTRTLPCRVLVREPGNVRALDRYGVAMARPPAAAPRSLLRGMFVEVHVHVAGGDPLVSIPEEAQRPSGDVWVMRDGRLEVLRPRPVQVSAGRMLFDAATSGLTAGDRVVVSPIAAPRPGMAIVEAGPPAAPAARVEPQGEPRGEEDAT